MLEKLRELLRERFTSYIETERLAASAYQQGATDRQGAEREQYLLYGATSERRALDWQQLHSRLDFDLFVGLNRIEEAAALLTAPQVDKTDGISGLVAPLSEQLNPKNEPICQPMAPGGVPPGGTWREMLSALKLIESVYRKNCVVEGEPSTLLAVIQAAIANAEASASPGPSSPEARACPKHGPLVGVRYCPECAIEDEQDKEKRRESSPR